MPKLLPETLYANLSPQARAVVDRAIDLLMEYTKMRGQKDGLALLKQYTLEENRQALREEYDAGEIRLELQSDLLVWLCYLPEEDKYRPIGAALRVGDFPSSLRN